MQKLFVNIAILCVSILAYSHGEDKKGPNGGYVRMPGAFHTETVVSDKNTLKVFLLDINWENPSVLKSEVKVILKSSIANEDVVCSSKKNYFLCLFSKNANLKQKGELQITATRENHKGDVVKYNLPLKLEKVPEMEMKKTEDKMDHANSQHGDPHGHHGEHREQEAHVHGGATLNIAFDQLKGKIEFKGAADGVVGFEHAAKSDQDKKTVADAIFKFEKNISTMVVFDPSLGCVVSQERIAVQSEDHADHSEEKILKSHKGEHSDFIANFNVECSKSVLGSKITFNFTSFQHINDLDVTILVDAVQKTVEVKKKPVTLEIK